jgi:hypothetical protein
VRDDVMPTLSQGHPCPQLFTKRHQTKDVCKDLLAESKKEEKRRREKRRRKRKEKCIHYSMKRGN